MRAKVRIQFYVDHDDYQILKRLSDEKRIPLSILCRAIISEYLSQLKKSSPL